MKLCKTQAASLIVISIAAFILFYVFLEYVPYLSILVTDALWATVLLTTVLVIINAYYAWQVRQTISEMEKARKADFIPHIRAELTWLGPVFLLLKFTNFGKGPATEINVEAIFEPSNEKKLWQESIMAPNEYIRIFLPDGKIDNVCRASAIVTVKGEYKDIFGKQFKINEKIDTKDFIDEAKQLVQLIEPDLNREVKNIKEGIKDLTKEIRNIRNILERQERARRG